MQEMRERLIADRESAVDRERERGQTKLHEQYERLESQFDQERKRFKDNSYTEASRVEQMLKQDNERMKEELKQLIQKC